MQSRLAVTSVPEVPQVLIQPLLADDSIDQPFEQLPQVRLRRRGDLIHAEWEGTNEWFNVYFFETEPPSLMTCIGSALQLTNHLSLKRPNTDAARLVERHAPRGAALARYMNTTVGGHSTIALQIPAGPEGHTTLLVVGLDRPATAWVDEEWLTALPKALEVTFEISQECAELQTSFAALSSGEQQRLLEGPTTSWEPVRTAADLVSVANSILKLATVVSG